MNETPETTLLSMFWTAHPVVKIVMIGLLAASFWCWAIIVNKTLTFRRFRIDMDDFEQSFWSGQSLEDLYSKLAQQPAFGAASLFKAVDMATAVSTTTATSAEAAVHTSKRVKRVLNVPEIIAAFAAMSLGEFATPEKHGECAICCAATLKTE